MERIKADQAKAVIDASFEELDRAKLNPLLQPLGREIGRVFNGFQKFLYLELP